MLRAVSIIAAAALSGCVVDPSPQDERVAPPRQAAGLRVPVAPFDHPDAGFSVLLPVGGTWTVVNLPRRLLALEVGVLHPVTIVISLSPDLTADGAEALWKSSFEDKGFRVIERTARSTGLLLAAEGEEAVSGHSNDFVILRQIEGGPLVQCSVGAPVSEAVHWWRAIEEICESVELHGPTARG